MPIFFGRNIHMKCSSIALSLIFTLVACSPVANLTPASSLTVLAPTKTPVVASTLTPVAATNNPYSLPIGGISVPTLDLASLSGTSEPTMKQDNPNQGLIGDPSAQNVSEDDWWLPEWVQPSPNSGYYGGSGTAPYTFPTITTVMLPWKYINPQENVYDWSLIDEPLMKGETIWVRFFLSDVSHVPDWFKQKHPTLKHNRYLWPDGGYDDVTGYIFGNGTIHSDGDFYAVWDPRYEAEYKKLLAAFQSRYANNPQIAMIYFPDMWRWGEYSLKFIPEMIKDGITPKAYLDWFHRIWGYYSAASGNPGKLVYTGDPASEWIQDWPNADFMTAADRAAWGAAVNLPDGGTTLSKFTLDQGGGARSGFTEVFNHFAQSPSWGITLTNSGSYRYTVVDDNNPLIKATDRFFGTENEDFAYMWPATDHYYFWKMAYLNSLRLRMNWVFAGDYSASPEIIDYARLTMGKHVNNSPDAWVALRQYKDTWVDSTENIRNFERWLYQRDVANGGQTYPTYQTNYTSDYLAENGSNSYEALRTDTATENDYIYFNIDDAFIKGGQNKVMIKVTYLDNFASQWGVQYTAPGNGYKDSIQITNANDNKWKTVSFTISDAAFDNSQVGGMDFRIYNGGSGHDIVVRFVRVIKLK